MSLTACGRRLNTKDNPDGFLSSYLSHHCGAFMLLMEFLINLTFRFERFIGWSLYPLVTLVLLGGLLIFLGICRPTRETMERKFFI